MSMTNERNRGSFRILSLAPQPFLSYRGTPLATFSLIKALARLGHRVDLLSFPQGTSVSVEGLRHFRSRGLAIRTVRPGPSLRKLLLDVPFFLEAAARIVLGRYDAVHAVEEAVFLAPIARARGLPLIADVDSWIPEQLEESRFLRGGSLLRLVTTVYRAALRSATLVFTPCASLTKRVRREIPLSDVVQLDDVPLQEDPELLGPIDPVHLQHCLFQGGPPNQSAPKLVAYCGNFEPNQGVELVVAASERYPEARFIFVGGDPEQVGALEAGARRRGVGDRCLFMGHQTPRASLGVIDLADILVVPRTRGKHTGFKIPTYMASGKPIVATRIAAHTQVLDGTTATLVEPTAAGIAEGIERVLKHPQEAAARALQAKAHAERHFGIGRYHARVAEALERLRRPRASVRDDLGHPLLMEETATVRQPTRPG